MAARFHNQGTRTDSALARSADTNRRHTAKVFQRCSITKNDGSTIHIRRNNGILDFGFIVFVTSARGLLEKRQVFFSGLQGIIQGNMKQSEFRSIRHFDHGWVITTSAVIFLLESVSPGYCMALSVNSDGLFIDECQAADLQITQQVDGIAIQGSIDRLRQGGVGVVVRTIAIFIIGIGSIYIDCSTFLWLRLRQHNRCFLCSQAVVGRGNRGGHQFLRRFPWSS